MEIGNLRGKILNLIPHTHTQFYSNCKTSRIERTTELNWAEFSKKMK